MRRNDTGGDGAAQAERVADRDHPVPNTLFATVAERDIRQRFIGVDLQQREIGFRVAPNDFRREALTIGQCYLNVMRVIDDVVIGDDVARRIDQEAGAQSMGRLHMRLSLPVEEVAEHLPHWRIGREVRHLPLEIPHALFGGLVAALGRRDIDDGGANFGGQIGEAGLVDDRSEA